MTQRPSNSDETAPAVGPNQREGEIPDRSKRPALWKYVLIGLGFLVWLGFLIYCSLAGRLES